MKFKSTVNRIVNKYLELQNECERKGLDMEADDDKIYKEWLEKISNQIVKKMSNDLVEMCEDNDVMADCIREYFGVKNNNEDYGFNDEDFSD